MCTCAFCRKKKAKATNTKFESRRGKKRSLRCLTTRDGKRRRLYENTDSSSTVEDSDEFVEEDREDEDEEEEFVGHSPVPTPTIPTPRSSTVDSRLSRRVTLKDLIDAGILADGDEMHFKKTCEFSGILQPDGQISCGGHVCPTLSTFAKYAASELGTKWSRQNGWCLVYCRSKCLYDLRKEYMDNFVESSIPEYFTEEDETLHRADSIPVRSCPQTIPGFDTVEIYDEDSDTEHNCLSTLQEHIRVAAHYHWLKYELQHSPEHIYGAPIFIDSRPPFDPEHDNFVSSEFDIRDKDFFPVTFEEGAQCC